jgi:hypothetical protein
MRKKILATVATNIMRDTWLEWNFSQVFEDRFSPVWDFVDGLRDDDYTRFVVHRFLGHDMSLSFKNFQDWTVIVHDGQILELQEVFSQAEIAWLYSIFVESLLNENFPRVYHEENSWEEERRDMMCPVVADWDEYCE